MPQLFTRTFIVSALLLLCNAAFAQRPLTNSRQSSYYTYIYKLSAADVLGFYKSPLKPFDDKVLRNPVDSFRTDKYWENNLPTGNYVKVFAQENMLKYTVIENHSAFLKLFKGKYEYRFALTDKQGNYLNDAKVLLNGHNVAYDAASNTWHFKQPKTTRILQVDHNGVSNYFSISPLQDYPHSALAYRLRKFWYGIKNIFHSNRRRYKPSPYGGFMVFNKPIYKPGDTVKFKAFVFNGKNKKPIAQKSLLVKLVNMDGVKKLGTVSCYRPGGFEYSFVVADSLDLSLDRDYDVLLTDPAKQPKHKDGNDEEEDEDDARNSKSVIYTSRFSYEEYELKSIHFAVRADKKKHSPGNPLSVYLKATDENGLPVADGRIILTLVTSNVSSYKTNQQFVPDTLWTYKGPLEAVGETKVIIPDSIFPKADINYTIRAQFLNANNEQQYSEVQANYKYERYTVSTEVVNDSLKINHFEFGKPYQTKGIVSALNAAGDTLIKQTITLPGFVLINPNAKEYNIETDSTNTDLDMKDFEGNISISSDRTKDSVYISVSNPRKLHFFYSVFTGTKLIANGQGDKLYYRKQMPTGNIVVFTLNYLWGGEVKTENIYSTYREDWLNITVNQPVSVYPGQKVKTDIVVTDADGKALANTDVTAWAITKKFDYNGPPVPYVGKPKKYPKQKKEVKLDDRSFDGGLALNWERWGREIGLDSIAYYRFTHPKTNIYRIEEPGIDTVTQIAPFVVKDGNILPIHILYIDHLPVYFSQAQQLQPYSFKVSPGYHSISLRTAKLDISMDSIWVTKSKKLIMSMNANTYPSQPVTDILSFAEADNINKYMISVVNNFDMQSAMIAQSDRIYLLNPSGVAGSRILTGPLSPNYTVFDRKGDKPRSFLAEPNYTYLFSPGLIKQTSIKTDYPFQRELANIPGTTNYRQYVLTNSAADSLWQDFLDNRANRSYLFNNPQPATKENGRLEIQRLVGKKEKPALIKNVILYRYDDPDYIRIYPGYTLNFSPLEKGRYRMLFLLKGDSYDIKENVVIKTHGINHYNFSISPQYARDSVSIKISTIINNRKSDWYRNADDEIENDALRLKEAFNGRYLATTGWYTELITGTVMAKDDGLPVPGATVKIKGTTIGTQTTNTGKFSIMARTGVKLIVSFLGYKTQELNVVPGGILKIVLESSPRQLGEVVVTGYLGIKRAKNLSYSISNVTNFANGLSGKAPGLLITQADATLDSNMRFTLRGNKALTGDGTALIILDGVPLKSLTRIDPSLILEVTVLKSAAATALYGSEAANGVIIITTKKPGDADKAVPESPVPEGTQTLRKNFSDYAYWQPKLTTDASGKASFSSVFPDDITNWRTFVVAINGQRQSGFSEKQIRSFKPLSANFIAPQFAVEGDEMSLIGKVMNYNSTPAKLSRTFSYNGKILAQGDFDVSNSKIDTLPIVASATDSLSFEYSIKRDNGYFDGEQRKIPVVKQGVQETKGIFEALDRDTTINLQFDPALGPITFRAEASALPALAEEAKRLREYKYLCNEQLASKLKGLLSEKRIKTFLGETFKYERNILEVISKLQQNRKANGTWGWWANTDEELWISLHAIEALAEAQKMGFTVQLDKQKLSNYLVYQLESYRGDDKLTCLQLLHQLDAKVDYAKYFGVIEKEYKALKEVSNYNRLKLLLLKQQTGISIKTDSLLSKAHKTLFGNMYWGEENYRFFDNSVQQSVIVYQIIKSEGKHPEVLAKIRGYFLEQRKLGEWRNTYESALILETILPDLLQKGTQLKPSVLTLKGSTIETVTVFPYTATLKENTISVSKTGSLPVYITGYQQFWNSKPQKVNKDFTVNTWFEKNGDKRTLLKGGEAVQLKAEVIVKGDADFVMLEIPIPAGCSYESKEQQWGNNEAHREFFKEKVSIFCRKLKEGTYTFTVNLMPRYSGNYTLNPAKAEQMYFPVFYGREGMKKILVH